MTIDRYLRMIAGAFVLLTPRARLLGEPVLVSVHRVRRTQPVSIGLHELVSDDDHSSEVGRPQQLTSRILAGATRSALVRSRSKITVLTGILGARSLRSLC